MPLRLPLFLLVATGLLPSRQTSRPPDYHPLPVTSELVREGALALRDTTDYRNQDLIAPLAWLKEKPSLPGPPSGTVLVDLLVTVGLGVGDWDINHLYLNGNTLVDSKAIPFRWRYQYRPYTKSEGALLRSSRELKSTGPTAPVSFEPVDLLALRPAQTLPLTVLQGSLGNRPFRVLATESPGVPDTLGHRLTNGFIFYPVYLIFSKPFVPGTVTSGIGAMEEEQRFQVVGESGEVWAEALLGRWDHGRLKTAQGMPWGTFRIFGDAPQGSDAELESIFSAIVVLSYAARDFDGVNTEHIPGDFGKSEAPKAK